MHQLKIFKDKNSDQLIINDKFIFIRIPRTGTTSLFTECKKHHLIRNYTCYTHEGIVYISNTIPHFYKRDIYCIVRNPFQQVLSWYMYCNRNNVNITESFNKWLKRGVGLNDVHTRQADYVLINNKIPPNLKIFKFEDGLESIIKFLNDKYNLNLNTLHINSNPTYNPKYWKNYYSNRENIKLVLESKKREFELFGYSSKIY